MSHLVFYIELEHITAIVVNDKLEYSFVKRDKADSDKFIISNIDDYSGKERVLYDKNEYKWEKLLTISKIKSIIKETDVKPLDS